MYCNLYNKLSTFAVAYFFSLEARERAKNIFTVKRENNAMRIEETADSDKIVERILGVVETQVLLSSAAKEFFRQHPFAFPLVSERT